MLLWLSLACTVSPFIIGSAYFPLMRGVGKLSHHTSGVVDLLKSKCSSFNLLSYCDLNTDLKSDKPSSVSQKEKKLF